MSRAEHDVVYVDLCDAPLEWRELLRVWRNKPHVRSEMVSQAEISPAEHSEWLRRILSSGSKDKIRIAVLDGLPFGMVRLMNVDRENSSSDWGVYIGEEKLLGLGFGKKMLIYLIEWAFVEEKLKELNTKVHKKNLKAQSIYKKAGFYVTGETGDYYTMSLQNNGESKIWTVGHGGNGREMPLELKRHFAWVFASAKLPVCIDSGAVIEIRQDSEDIHLKWRDIVFKLNSHSDIEILSEKMPYADAIIPKTIQANSEWGFVALDTKDDLGFSALLAASMEEFKKVLTFCDNSANFMLNKYHSKIELLVQGHAGKLEDLCLRFDSLPIFVEFSLSGVDDPLQLTEKIRECGQIKGISIKNDLPIHEKELPQKIIEIVQDSGFRGSAMSRIFTGIREYLL
ncbi:MAG: GNAT family N-acetyltransferase [Synergistaceae bacterium]|nr:GNAT family N-acetyltransferase [Synergistaceae bacterium]